MNNIQNILSFFKSPLKDFIIIIAVFFLYHILFSIKIKANIIRKVNILLLIKYFRKYQIFIKYSFIIISIAASFSFFGKSLGKPSYELNLYLDTVRQGYAINQLELNEIFGYKLKDTIYKKVLSENPQIDASIIKYRDFRIAETFKIYYEELKTKYELDNKQLNIILEQYETRNQQLSKLIQEISSSQESKHFENLHSKINIQQKLNENESISKNKNFKLNIFLLNYKNKISKQISKILITNEGKELLSNCFKIFTNELNPLENFDLLNPLGDAMVGILDDKIQEKIDKSIAKILNEYYKNDMINMDQMIDKEIQTFEIRPFVNNDVINYYTTTESYLSQEYSEFLFLKQQFYNNLKYKRNFYTEQSKKKVKEIYSILELEQEKSGAIKKDLPNTEDLSSLDIVKNNFKLNQIYELYKKEQNSNIRLHNEAFNKLINKYITEILILEINTNEPIERYLILISIFQCIKTQSITEEGKFSELKNIAKNLISFEAYERIVNIEMNNIIASNPILLEMQKEQNKRLKEIPNLEDKINQKIKEEIVKGKRRTIRR